MDSFVRKETVVKEFQVYGNKYRFLNYGAGPDVLQLYSDGEWRNLDQCDTNEVVKTLILLLEHDKMF